MADETQKLLAEAIGKMADSLNALAASNNKDNSSERHGRRSKEVSANRYEEYIMAKKGRKISEKERLAVMTKHAPKNLKDNTAINRQKLKAQKEDVELIKASAGAAGKVAAAFAAVVAASMKVVNKIANLSNETAKATATLRNSISNSGIGKAFDEIKEAGKQVTSVFEKLSDDNMLRGINNLVNIITGNKQANRGIAEATYNTYKADKIANMMSLGYDWKSAEALSEQSAAAVDNIYNRKGNKETWTDIAGSITSGAYGITGKESTAFAGWLFSEKGELIDYLNEAQLVAREQEFIYAQSKEYAIGGIEAVSELNNGYTELGNSIKQAGNNLYSFDEVISNQAKNVNIERYGWNEQSKELINYDENANKAYKDVTEFVEFLNAVNGNVTELELMLVQRGYDPETAREIVSYLMENPDRKTSIELAWSVVQGANNGNFVSLDDVKTFLVEMQNGKYDNVNTKLGVDVNNDLNSIVDKLEKLTGTDTNTIKLALSGDSIKALDRINQAYSEFISMTGNDELNAEKLQNKQYWERNGVSGTINVEGNLMDAADIAKGASGGVLSDKEVAYLVNVLLDTNGAFSADNIIDFFTEAYTYRKRSDVGEIGNWQLGSNQDEYYAKLAKKYANYEYIDSNANGGVVTSQELSWIGEGNKAEAVIPLETQGGIEYLANAMQQAGLSGTTVNVTLNGKILEMNGYNARRLGDELSNIINSNINRQGGNQ